MTFDSFPLSSQLIDAIAICGYQNLTPVQQQVMPIALARHDVIACAQTGTGKTAAYAIPMLQWLLDNADDSQSIKALVMTPTRELAIQVAENIQQYSQFAELKTVAVYGGANINPQRKAIAAGADILVATPGRLFDIIGQYSVDLSSVDTLIIDEADRMLDLGFVKDIERIKKHLKPQHCCQLFSATYSEGIAQLAHKMLNAPQRSTLSRVNKLPLLSNGCTPLINAAKLSYWQSSLAVTIGVRCWCLSVPKKVLSYYCRSCI